MNIEFKPEFLEELSIKATKEYNIRKDLDSMKETSQKLELEFI